MGDGRPAPLKTLAGVTAVRIAALKIPAHVTVGPPLPAQDPCPRYGLGGAQLKTSADVTVRRPALLKTLAGVTVVRVAMLKISAYVTV